MTVWIPDPVEGYIPVTVARQEGRKLFLKKNTNGSPALVDSNDTTIAYTNDAVYQDIEKPVPDCCQLDSLSIFSILRNLELRFQQKETYTKVSKVLISLNPCGQDIGLTPCLDLKKVLNTILFKGSAPPAGPPHPSQLVVEAITSKADVKGHTIVISGDAGSGKTETAKVILKVIADIVSAPKDQVSDWLQAIHPIAESIGNAATSRNANSSRYGRSTTVRTSPVNPILMQVRFLGLKTQGFLLERSRVVSILPGEGSFHIFQILKLGLRGWVEENEPQGPLAGRIRACLQKIIPRDSVYTAVPFSRLPEGRSIPPFTIEEVVAGLLKIGCSVDECYELFGGIVAVLLLTAMGRPSDETSADKLMATITVKESIPTLLGIDSSNLTKLLSTKVITQDETFFREVNDVKRNMKSMAMEVYERLFNLIMSKLAMRPSSGSEGKRQNITTLSILDIFGFENLTRNSLSQLHINYANEKLQELFIEQKLRAEIMLFNEQRVVDLTIEEVDNADLILTLCDLRGHSIIGQLDEITTLMRNSPPAEQDQKYIERLRMLQKTHPRVADYLSIEQDIRIPQTSSSPPSSPLLKQKTKPMRFSVRHSGQCLAYVVEAWAYQNVDKGLAGLAGLLTSSEYKSISVLAELEPQSPRSFSPPNPSDSRQTFRTVSQTFCSRINQLHSRLRDQNLQFIKCIKPNADLQEDTFDRKCVLEQLDRLGIYPLVRCFESCFSVRIPYGELRSLTSDKGKLLDSVKISTTRIPVMLQTLAQWAGLESDQYRVGTSILFLTSEGSRCLKMKLRTMTQLGDLQTMIKKALKVHAFRKVRAAAIAFEFIGKSFLVLKEKAANERRRLKLKGWSNPHFTAYLGLLASRKLVDSADELTKYGIDVRVKPMNLPPSAQTMYTAFSAEPSPIIDAEDQPPENALEVTPSMLLEETPQRRVFSQQKAFELHDPPMSPKTLRQKSASVMVVTQKVDMTTSADLDDMPSETLMDLARIEQQSSGTKKVVRMYESDECIESYESFSPKKTTAISDDLSAVAGGPGKMEPSTAAPSGWAPPTTVAAPTPESAPFDQGMSPQTSSLTRGTGPELAEAMFGSPQTVPHPNLHVPFEHQVPTAPAMTALGAASFTASLTPPPRSLLEPQTSAIGPGSIPMLSASAAAAQAAQKSDSSSIPECPEAPPPSLADQSRPASFGDSLPCIDPLLPQPLSAPKKIVVTTVPVATIGSVPPPPTPLSTGENLVPTPMPPSSQLVPDGATVAGVTVEPPPHLLGSAPVEHGLVPPTATGVPTVAGLSAFEGMSNPFDAPDLVAMMNRTIGPSASAEKKTPNAVEVKPDSLARPRSVWRPKVRSIVSVAPKTDQPGNTELLIAHIQNRAWTLHYRTEETQVRVASDSEGTCSIKDLDLTSIYETPWTEITYEYKVGPDSLVWRPIDCEALIAARSDNLAFLLDRKFNVYMASVFEHGRFPRQFLGRLPEDLVGAEPHMSRVIASLHIEEAADRHTFAMLMRYDEGPPALVLWTAARDRKNIRVCQRTNLPVDLDTLECTFTPALLLWHRTARSLIVLFEGTITMYHLQNSLLLHVPTPAVHDPLGLTKNPCLTIGGCEVDSHIVLLTSKGQVYRLVCDPSRQYLVPKTDLFDAMDFPEIEVQLIKDLNLMNSVRDKDWAGVSWGVCQLPQKRMTCVVTGKEGEIILSSIKGQVTSAYRLRPGADHNTLAFRPFGTSCTAKQCMILVCEADWKVLFLDLDLGELICIKGLPDPLT